MKKLYQQPTITQIAFEEEDVIRTSTPLAEEDFFVFEE